ncbi:MAG: hypothetical protein E7813_02990 [Bradyrhizobium sp.]|uniref:hypothetical protein n=1 Tax=Bradyrhizobium sp. TaxID=376 RepID=UPI001201BB3E|nr:hypothetical protein [Bradyrhizobium sp.]THD73562.1 MAG: hypothetical protein E7813_02990 [Bradyrhizobium sp.]
MVTNVFGIFGGNYPSYFWLAVRDLLCAVSVLISTSSMRADVRSKSTALTPHQPLLVYPNQRTLSDRPSGSVGATAEIAAHFSWSHLILSDIHPTTGLRLKKSVSALSDLSNNRSTAFMTASRQKHVVLDMDSSVSPTHGEHESCVPAQIANSDQR